MRFVLAVSLCLSIPAASSATTPESIKSFTSEFCTSCHGANTQKGDFRFDALFWKLADTDSREQWQLVYEYVAKGDMPPEKAKKRPNTEQRQAFLKTLKVAFTQADLQASVGGTTLRRLNRVEYLNTVRDLFGIRMIKLPLSFPEDATSAEFDTMPDGLFLSPAVMEAYHETATDIADRLVPLPDPPTYAASYTVLEIGGDATRRWFSRDKEYLKFTGFNNSGWSGALWDSQFVAPASGVYRVRLLANAQASSGADDKPLRLAFYAFDPTEEQLPKRYRRDRASRVAEIDIPAGEARWIECEVPVEAGETFHIYCDNRFPIGKYSMGALNRGQINKTVKQAIKESNPTVELRELAVQGPVGVLPRVRKFFGQYPPKLSREELEAKLLPIATRAFRRPLSDVEKDKLITAVLAHSQKVDKPEFAWHYAIRRILCSPEFLYREAEQSKSFSQFALASRLSYFLWSTMPDDELLELATAGRLSDAKVLKEQTVRLIEDPRSQQFVKHFTGQWLGNRAVASINVCDNRYKWDDNVRYGFVRSTEMFFDEILRRNLPISTFIDSDFTYANNAMQVVWGIKGAGSLNAIAAHQRQSLVWPEPERISLSRPLKGMPAHVISRGGVLGLPGVLTVTGDGVESSPILRGVWVLENMFGQAPPPPPKDVPALDIDTSKATSVRETLAAHQKIETCAKCHRDIDPLGLALENYDAIGGWRDRYLKEKSDINVTAKMPDGRELDGAGSIKELLLESPEIFTRCLLRKLLEYGAGRELSIGDQRIVEQVVAAAPKGGYRFQDLIVAATTSSVFRAK